MLMMVWDTENKQSELKPLRRKRLFSLNEKCKKDEMCKNAENLVSISSTFYAHILCQYFGAKNYKAKMYLEKAALSFGTKNARLKC